MRGIHTKNEGDMQTLSLEHQWFQLGFSLKIIIYYFEVLELVIVLIHLEIRQNYQSILVEIVPNVVPSRTYGL